MGGFMPEYRIYVLDDAGHSSQPPWTVTCNDDNKVQAEARKKLLDGSALEIWCGERKVATIKPTA